MPNIALQIAYDGTEFVGWQKSPFGKTIEQELELVLKQVLQIPVVLQAASRTDAKVHAVGQVVNFFIEKPLNLQKLLYSLNCLLPSPIRVLKIAEAKEAFHPTLHSIEKEYIYNLSLGPIQLPHERLYSWHCHEPLDLSKMKEAASHLIGRHDFKAFCNQRKQLKYQDTIRTLKSIEFYERDNQLTLSIIGDHFLYKMVRNIVGLLKSVGEKKLCPSLIPSILSSKDRKCAPLTAPAHGLTLKEIRYCKEWAPF